MDIEFFLMSVFAGIMGSYGLLSMAMWADSLGLPRLDFSRAMANLTYSRTFETEAEPGAKGGGPNTPYWPGMIVIFMNGIFFALLLSCSLRYIHCFEQYFDLPFGNIFSHIIQCLITLFPSNLL